MERTRADRSRRLPSGQHGLPPELVERNQRERLIAAMAEVCAERGYAMTSVADVTRAAGVSTASFYKQFKDKPDCMLATFDELLGRLQEEIESACKAEPGRETKVRMAIGTALSLLAEDPPTAQLLSVEILALGQRGAERRDTAIESFASFLHSGGEHPRDPSQPHAAWALTASMIALVSKLVTEGKADHLPELEDELVAMALSR